MYTGEFETTREVLSEIASTTGEIFQMVVVIMCAILMSALAVLYVVDQSRYIKGKDRQIKTLNRNVQALERSRTDGYRKNGETSDAADTFFGMYLEEKERADTNEKHFKEWDAKQVKRIKALENQLKENGIEPIKWEEIKNCA